MLLCLYIAVLMKDQKGKEYKKKKIAAK